MRQRPDVPAIGGPAVGPASSGVASMAGVPLLLYHSIAEAVDVRFAEWAVSPQLFDAHLDYLVEAGYRTLTVSELVERVFERRAPLEPRTIAITFDDGFEDFYLAAWPALRRRGLTATMYVTTGAVGRASEWLAPLGEGARSLMTWDQISEISEAGIECGAHTETHPQLDITPRERARAEIAGSKRALERVVGPVKSFAYPHGYHSRALRQEVQRAGFRSACAVGDGLASQADRYAIARKIVRGGMGVEALERALNGPLASSRRFRRVAWRAVRRVGAEGLRPTASPGRLRATTPAPRDAWRELLAADSEALVSQTPEWIDAMTATGRFTDASRLYETQRGERLLLPLVRARNPLPTPLAPLASMPHAWGMGGVLAQAPLRASDVDAVVSDLASLPAVRTTVRPNPVQAPAWAPAARHAVVLPRRAHVLDLIAGADAIWSKRFTSAARSAVRRGERAGLDIRTGADAGLVADFHHLLQLSVARWAENQNEPATLARARAARRDPLQKFLAWSDALGEEALRISIAYRDGVPAAAIVVLLGRNANYTRGAMDARVAARTGANELLHWLAIQEACAHECRHYHMGETGSSESLARFKEKLGARPVDYAEYRWERLPLTRADAVVRNQIKRLIGFSDA